jgi:hypothetical protein
VPRRRPPAVAKGLRSRPSSGTSGSKPSTHRSAVINVVTFASAQDQSIRLKRNDFRNIGILWAITLLTRLPFLGIAEPDSALFVIGAKQWLRGGPRASTIYSAQTSGFYYALVTGAIRHLHLTEQSCSILMSSASAIACLGILLLGYLLGLRFIGSSNAFKAMLLFCVSPTLWWATIEPHPQAVSLCFALLGIWSFVRFLGSERIWLALASPLCFGIAIALKSDAVLLLPALCGVSLLVKTAWRTFWVALAVAALAGAISLLAARLVIGTSSEAVHSAMNGVTTYFTVPDPINLLVQLIPLPFGLGLLTCFLIALALVGKLVYSEDKLRWWVLVLAWCLPGYLFWIVIRGNSVRHLLAFGIPLFWLAGTRFRWRPVIACILLGALVPPNSNMLLFPSPNVPGSLILFAHKKDELNRLAKRLSKAPSCFIGTYTNDYILEDLLDSGGQISGSSTVASSAVTPEVIHVTTRDGNAIELIRKSSSGNRVVQLGPCLSAEYRNDGRRTRFLGSEWHVPVS